MHLQQLYTYHTKYMHVHVHVDMHVHMLLREWACFDKFNRESYCMNEYILCVWVCVDLLNCTCTCHQLFWFSCLIPKELRNCIHNKREREFHIKSPFLSLSFAPSLALPTIILFFSFLNCRRAQLRDCLEVLRQHVPFPDKLTTLALLQSARKYIEVSTCTI